MAPPPNTPWLTADQQHSWRMYLRGITVLSERLDRDLRECHSLSLMEYEILVRLSEADERRVRMADLADALSHSRSRITHTVSRLERGGHVKRVACAEDGRGVSAELTDDGFALLAEAAHTHVSGVHDYFVATMTPAEFDLVGEIFARVGSVSRE